MQQTLAISSIKGYASLVRVHQWVKNLFIFIPAFFGHALFGYNHLFNLIIGFISFSFVASSIYIVNDYTDVEKDRLHPKKSKRALASGAVSMWDARILFILFFSLGFGLALLLGSNFVSLLAGYFLMNIAYTFYLKNISLIDISIISLGFLLRIFAGGIIADVSISKWLVLMTFLLSLLLAIAKRRDDVLIKNNNGLEMRNAIGGYNITFVNISMVFLASITVVAYIMYTVSSEVIAQFQNEHIYLTSFFVIMGILRYLQITLVDEKSGSPTEILLKDTFIQVTLCGWIICFGFFIYVF